MCSLTATMQELKNALHQQSYQILPLDRVVRTTTVESRTIDAGFYGVGLPHLGIEELIVMTNKLIMHYGCNTATGKLMQTSYSLFYVEAGLFFHPLQESYARYGGLVTHSWMKMLWEKLLVFNVKLVIADGTQTYLRVNNQFVMQVLISKGYSGETLRRLNRVQVSQQVLFMSDILTASGNKIDIDTGIQRAEEDSIDWNSAGQKSSQQSQISSYGGTHCK